VIKGGAGADMITGGDERYWIDAGLGDDTIFGGAGIDSIWGGEGFDVFRFDTALEGVDKVQDFTRGSDRIGITAANFGIDALVEGVSFFSGAGAVAPGGSAAFLYDTARQTLSYDADGAGAGVARALAVLAGVTSLSASDFLIL
jgi:Ca2+-binding RTX toxin-like protein